MSTVRQRTSTDPEPGEVWHSFYNIAAMPDIVVLQVERDWVEVKHDTDAGERSWLTFSELKSLYRRAS